MKDKYVVKVCKYKSGNYPYFVKRKRNSLFSWRWKPLRVMRDGVMHDFVQDTKMGILEFFDKFDSFNADIVDISGHYMFVHQENCKYKCEMKL